MAVYNILNFADSAPQGISSEVSCFSIWYVEVKAQSISAEVKHNHAHLLPRLPIDNISIVELGLALQQRSSKCAYMSPGQVCTFQFLLASE